METCSIDAIASCLIAFGRILPDSHDEIAAALTPRWAAKSTCARPLFVLNRAIRPPRLSLIDSCALSFTGCG